MYNKTIKTNVRYNAMNKVSDTMDIVRKALLCAAIDAIESIPQHGKTNIGVIVCSPDTKEEEFLWDAPEQLVQDGQLSLNISEDAIGSRVFGDTTIQVKISLDGRDTTLNIPYGLVVRLSCISKEGGILAGESFGAFTTSM